MIDVCVTLVIAVTVDNASKRFSIPTALVSPASSHAIQPVVSLLYVNLKPGLLPSCTVAIVTVVVPSFVLIPLPNVFIPPTTSCGTLPGT